MARQGVVAMVADMTEENEEANMLLKQLGNQVKAIPFYAIFPANNPNKPILLDSFVTKGQLMDAIKHAGPTKLHTETVATAPRQQK